MMKRLFLAFISFLLMVILTTGSSYAQISLGAGAGFNRFKILGTWVDNIPLMGNQFTIVTEKAINDTWAAHIGITYSMQYSLDFLNRMETGMEYIKVQPMVKFTGFPSDWMKRMYAQTGIYYGHATTGFIREHIVTDNVMYFEETKLSPGKNCIKKASDLGLATELGVQINKVRIGVFGQAGFFNISNVKNQKFNNWGLGINVVYVFIGGKPALNE